MKRPFRSANQILIVRQMLLTGILIAGFHQTSAVCYERPGQLEVLEPAPEVKAAKWFSVEEFLEHYRAAGQPRIVLFWDIAFDAHTEMQGGGLEHSKQASFGDGYYSSVERLGSAARVDPSERLSGVAAGDTAAIQSAFIATLLDAGVGLVDRGTVMRSMHAGKSRDETNRKLIETDAILEYADLLLEVLPTWDANAPLGYGFRVSCRELSTGMSLLGYYYNSEPAGEALPGGYIANERGFEWYQPAAEPASLEEFGRDLAVSTLTRLGPRLLAVRNRD